LFPARIAGEPWGGESVTLDLAGGPFHLTGLSTEQVSSLRDRFAKQMSSGAGYPIAVFRASASDFLPIDTKGWEYELEFDGPRIIGMDLMARV